MTLATTTVHYYYTQLDGSNIQKSLKDLLKKNLPLSSSDAVRFDFITHPLRKIQFAASRLLIQRMNEEIDKKTALIKECKKNDTHVSSCGLSVWSITHSQNYVAVASSNVKCLGIDSEYKKLNRPFEKIANRVFQVPLYQALLDSPMDHQKNSLFYQWWSEKEARYKAGFKPHQPTFMKHWEDKEYTHCCISSSPIKLIRKKIGWKMLIQCL